MVPIQLGRPRSLHADIFRLADRKAQLFLGNPAMM